MDVQTENLLLHELEYGNVQTSRKALDTIYKLEHGKMVELFIRATVNKDAAIRRSAAHSLGSIGDPIGFEPLLDLLHDQHSQIRAEALRSLAKLDSERALEKVLYAVENDKEIRIAAIETLHEMGRKGDNHIIDLLLNALQDEDWRVRATAASAIGDLGDGRAIEPLILLLYDERSEVKTNAIFSLYRLEVKDERALELLVNLYYKADAEERREIARTLGSFSEDKVLNILLQALSDSDFYVRFNAVRSLGNLADKRATYALIELLNEYRLQNQVVEALGKIPDERAIVPLTTLFNSSENDLYFQELVGEALDKIKAATKLLS